MVNVTTKDGKIVISNILPMPNETADKMEATIKANKKLVSSMMKDLNIEHWIETKGDNRCTIVSRSYSSEGGIDPIEEIKSLRLIHQRFVESLCGMEHQKPHPEETNDAPEETDEEAEKFLDYALVCKLQELVSSCSAIIIAIPK